MKLGTSFLIVVVGGWLAQANIRAQEAQVTVDAGQVTHRLSRYLTGACIEDVNHEIYGGLYSQLIFGESFQEPPPAPQLQGFQTYGGRWQPQGDILRAAAGEGSKLISTSPVPTVSEVGVQLRLPDNKNGNAGLVIRVSEAGLGADRFNGYEISLEAGGYLVLGRHRQNWEPIQRVGCEVPLNKWIDLTVRMTPGTLEILVDGRSLTTYHDSEHPLENGAVGLRTWQREAEFRDFHITVDGLKTKLPFETLATETSGDVSGMWRAFHHGSARGEFALETGKPFKGVQSQRLTFLEGTGEIGIENQSLNRWGMNFVRGKPYEGYLWLRNPSPGAGLTLFVALENREDTRRYAEAPLHVTGDNWQRVDFKLRPDASDRTGRFAIKLKGPGSVCLGYAFLEPGAWGRFKGLPVRKDVSEGLIKQGLTVLRYGGSMINHPEYRWKKMIGPSAERPPYHGTWYAYSSNGWGIFDFLNFCEAAGFLGIPAVNMDESPQDMVDFFEYVNGPATSAWGRRRALDGHPLPYHLKYLELGNEEAVNEIYWQKFKALGEAIWSKDPQVILVVGDFAYDEPIKDPYNFSGAPNIQSLAAHKKILDLAREHQREVWFDVHIGTENPPAPNGLPGVRSFGEQLARLSPGAKFKLSIFEFNAGNHALKRALANACAINQLERLGEQIQVACSANCLQPYQQNDNGWNQGLLFLSPSQVWPQPPYFVTQMLSKNFLPLSLPVQVFSPGSTLDVTAAKSDDGKRVVVQVVNLSSNACVTHLGLNHFVPKNRAVQVTELAGYWEEINTPEQPHQVKPVASRYSLIPGQSSLTCSFPANSLSVLRFQ